MKHSMQDDSVLSGPPKSGEEILAMLERRMGSMKLVGERDDLLLECAVYIAKTLPTEDNDLTDEQSKFYRLCHPGGPGGMVMEEPTLQEQDAEAEPSDGYVVAFFPKITGLGPATLDWPTVRETLSSSPAAAIAKFMDRISSRCTWAGYQDAGHRVRKVRLVDLGDATDR